MTPVADAILADPMLAPAARRCLDRFFRWGAAPTVDAYCDLFAPGGTLLDADMEAPISGDAIRESITRVLALLPDFRFAPVSALHAGADVFVLASNTASLGDRPLAWPAVYALTLAEDRIAAGRRYYDQAALVLDTETFGGGAGDGEATSAAETGESTAGAPLGLDLARRADAWNRRDVAALIDPLAGARLHMSGVARPLQRPADVTAALGRFALRSDGLRVEPGAVVASEEGTGIEWIGTIGTGAARRRLSLVELIARREWRVLFNTLGM